LARDFRPGTYDAMSADERWDYLVKLDEELLKGGVTLSEKSAFLIRHTDLAFVNEAHLAAILTAVAAIESHLRAEHPEAGKRLIDLIEASDLAPELKPELQAIRRFRNSWVHVDDPWDDSSLLEEPEKAEEAMFEMAQRALVALRRTIYTKPWI
jgi:hypothetical protein